MNTLPVMQSLIMTSREIAELTGKRHDHVLRDIRIMLDQLSANPSLGWHCKSITYTDEQGKLRNQYQLDKNTTLTLISGYDAIIRFKIIKRWQELEEQAAAQASKIAEAATWDQQRQIGKEIRAGFTTTLENHGVSGFGFAQCTNGIYRPLFGTTAQSKKTTRFN